MGNQPALCLRDRMEGRGGGDRGGGERNMHMRLSIHYFLFDGLLWQL